MTQPTPPSQTRHALYGRPPADLSPYPADAIQTSPLVPEAARLEGKTSEFDSLTMLAPPGTLERRYTLALALNALAPGGRLVALAPKDKGGSRIAKELASFGCAVEEASRSHHRICTTQKPEATDALQQAMADGAPRFIDDLGLWSQPGIFSWDRLDPGSAQLLEHLPPLSGNGADFGCGLGYLAHGVLASESVRTLALVDIDGRAVDAARRNVNDPRVTFHWDDALRLPLSDLNFVVMNPPFHDGGIEDKNLGRRFIEKAAASLRRGGSLYIVANRHLPYEDALRTLFKRVDLLSEAEGYKVYGAVK